MAIITRSTGVILFAIIQFLVWAFAFVATPIAQFQTPGHGCYTFWGYRKWCGNVPYDLTGSNAFPCPQRLGTMRCGAAFGVMSAICTFVALVFAFLMNTRFTLPDVIPVTFCGISCITTMIAWACTAAVYNMSMCGSRFKDSYPFSAGFALMVSSWGLQVVNIGLYCAFALGEPVPEEEEEEPLAELEEPRK